jgi:hypothetical protein
MDRFRPNKPLSLVSACHRSLPFFAAQSHLPSEPTCQAAQTSDPLDSIVSPGAYARDGTARSWHPHLSCHPPDWRAFGRLQGPALAGCVWAGCQLARPWPGAERGFGMGVRAHAARSSPHRHGALATWHTSALDQPGRRGGPEPRPGLSVRLHRLATPDPATARLLDQPCDQPPQPSRPAFPWMMTRQGERQCPFRLSRPYDSCMPFW